MSIKPESSWWAGKEAMAVEFVSTLQDLLHKNKDLEINMVLLGFASRSARPVQPDFRISHLMPLLMVINPPSHFCANYPNPSVSQNNKAKLQRRRGIPPLNPKHKDSDPPGVKRQADPEALPLQQEASPHSLCCARCCTAWFFWIRPSYVLRVWLFLPLSHFICAEMNSIEDPQLVRRLFCADSL